MVIKYIIDSRKGLIILTFTVLFPYLSWGQQVAQDTVQLQEVVIEATRIQQPLDSQPTNVEVIDSSRIALLEGQNLGELLSSESSLFIKNNGPGSFSNASQRGLSSEQIQVLWEGIPIDNQMLGQTDLSLFPARLFSDVEISSGNPSSAFGGGSLSGAVYLSSDPKAGNYLSIRQSAGSYGQFQSNLQGGYSSENWSASLYAFGELSENDFTYMNRAYDRQERREHNRTERTNVMFSAERNWQNSSLSSQLWIADSDNQIPGTILSSSDQAKQRDQSTRWLTHFQSTRGNLSYSLKNYLSGEQLRYTDPARGTDSRNEISRWLISSDAQYSVFNNILLKGEISGALTGVTSNSFTSHRNREQFSALFNPELSFVDHRLHITPALRWDTYSDFGSVVSPSIGLNYELLSEKLFLRGQLSRDFNPPTFNALYWPQGGNPDLEAERSNSVEAGFTYKPDIAGFSSLKLTAFNMDVENGIRWFPDDNGTYAASNVEELISQGIEFELNNRANLPGEIQLQLRQFATMNDTRITSPRFSGDQAVDNQMRYVPKWKYNASLTIQKEDITGLVQYRWVDRRYYTDMENTSSSLDPYGVMDATLQYGKNINGIQITARGSVKNLLNTNYEIIQWYPMPRRHFHFSLTATYKF